MAGPVVIEIQGVRPRFTTFVVLPFWDGRTVHLSARRVSASACLTLLRHSFDTTALKSEKVGRAQAALRSRMSRQSMAMLDADGSQVANLQSAVVASACHRPPSVGFAAWGAEDVLGCTIGLRRVLRVYGNPPTARNKTLVQRFDGQPPHGQCDPGGCLRVAFATGHAQHHWINIPNARTESLCRLGDTTPSAATELCMAKMACSQYA